MRSDPASARRWLNDIRSQIELVQLFLGDLDYEAFRDDQLRFYAVTRCLEIISEASRRLPEDLKARHPSDFHDSDLVHRANELPPLVGVSKLAFGSL
jgi:uncharacterized protein with HEPN domain